MAEPLKADVEGVKNVALVDDHPMIRQGLRDLLSGLPDMRVCCEASSTDQAWEHIQSGRPDVVVLDLMLKSGSALDLLKKIKTNLPSTRVLVLSLHEEQLYGERVIRAGADGYITKEQSSDKIVEALRTILRGETYLSDRLREQLGGGVGESEEEESPDIATTLTDRELEIFELVGHGFSTKQIAHRLGISVKTVETHRANLKDKLRVYTAPELVRRAVLWVSNKA